MKLTGEQQQIVESKAGIIAVNAFAGTGKTATLVAYAKARPWHNLLYIAFNKAIQTEAAERFARSGADNVECKTAHALAYGKIGADYRHKLAGKVFLSDIAKRFRVPLITAKAAMGMVEVFMASASDRIRIEHVPSGDGFPDFSQRERTMLLETANALWLAMKDLNDPIPMVHDGYLKLYQMSDPILSHKYDIILFDEAQDASAAMVDIVMKQRCGKVFVGDIYQSIYGFRGSVNAMEIIKPEKTFSLTNSFRFGRGVAAAANLLLGEMRGEQRKITGLGKHQTALSNIDESRPYALISRTNAHLFDSAISAMKSGRPFGFVGGVSGYQFDKLADACHIFNRQPGLVKDAYLKSFPSFDDLKQFGKDADDKEIASLVKVVEKHGSGIYMQIDQIKARAVTSLEKAHLIMTTAHKAKGLEFDQVIMADDFADLMDEDHPASDEEVNIIYVAVTRAERVLQVNPKLLAWLRAHQASPSSRPARVVADRDSSPCRAAG